jgi:hypothetical protein
MPEDLVTFLGKRARIHCHIIQQPGSRVPSQPNPSNGCPGSHGLWNTSGCSQIGGLAYLVQDGITGFTVPVDDPHELASIDRLLQDHELRTKMGEQAVSVAKSTPGKRSQGNW